MPFLNISPAQLTEIRKNLIKEKEQEQRCYKGTIERLEWSVTPDDTLLKTLAHSHKLALHELFPKLGQTSFAGNHTHAMKYLENILIGDIKNPENLEAAYYFDTTPQSLIEAFNLYPKLFQENVAKLLDEEGRIDEEFAALAKSLVAKETQLALIL